MADTGPLNATEFGNNALIGTVGWDSPSSAQSEDGSTASVTIATPGLISRYLYARDVVTDLIDPRIVIDGIKIRVKRFADAFIHGAANDYSMRLVKDGTNPIGAEKATGTAIPFDTATYITYGGPTDKWGTTWTLAEVNSVGFGALYAAQVTDAPDVQSVYVDHIEFTIYYTPPRLLWPFWWFIG